MPARRRRGPKPKPKPKGRPAHKPTDVFRKQVTNFKGMGMTHDQISKMMGISDETLRKYYDHELNVADAKMNVNVANNLYNMATDPDHKNSITAAIFWLKMRGGPEWREVKRTELTGKDGQPLLIDDGRRDVIDSNDLTPEQRIALREILVQAVASKVNSTPAMIEGDYDDVTDDDEYEDEVEE